MTTLPQNVAEFGNDEMDKEAWLCMDSLDRWCKRRKALDNTLRQGWMQLVSARYAMGPARISEPLFSLKPQASQTVLEISTQQANKEGPVVFDLVKMTSRKGGQGSADPSRKDGSHQSAQPKLGLRRRPIFSSVEGEMSGPPEESQSHEYLGWDEEDEHLEVQKGSLQGFGALVSPHLRSAQSTFLKALQLAVELVNVRNDALDAHDKFSRLTAGMSSLSAEDEDHSSND